MAIVRNMTLLEVRIILPYRTRYLEKGSVKITAWPLGLAVSTIVGQLRVHVAL